MTGPTRPNPVVRRAEIPFAKQSFASCLTRQAVSDLLDFSLCKESTGVVGTMNSINVISPYKFAGRMWVFDDPRHGLVQEAFISGADVVIDRAVAHIPNAAGGFLLILHPSPFPATHSGSNGAGVIPKVIGTTPQTSMSKGGSALRC